MKNIAILTGAGISAESGIKTFREADGLWEEHRVEDVASPEGWKRDYKTVLNFYNERLKQLLQVQPNEGHKSLVLLEPYFNVQIITQNIDDLHEQAGSTNVLHLHGELKKKRSQVDPNYIVAIDSKEGIKVGDLCPYGKQMRPHIVWFGEAVPMIDAAVKIVEKADILIIIGTSLLVYPAAGLLYYAKHETPIYYIDPKENETKDAGKRLIHIPEKASIGVPILVKELIENVNYGN